MANVYYNHGKSMGKLKLLFKFTVVNLYKG